MGIEFAPGQEARPPDQACCNGGAPAMPLGSFGCILADPPWAFKTYSGKNGTPHRSANDHYGTLTAAKLREIPVGDLAAKDAALFMWVVDSHLDEAIRLGEAWGFKFKTIALVWAKTTASGKFRIGMGYWSRKQCEICILFTKGRPRRLSKGVRQLIIAQRREHSRKPDEQYERIEALVGGPYLELFARTQRSGWTVWGNETSKFDEAA